MLAHNHQPTECARPRARQRGKAGRRRIRPCAWQSGHGGGRARPRSACRRAPAAVDFNPADDNAKAQRRREAEVFAGGQPFLRLGVLAPLRLIPPPRPINCSNAIRSLCLMVCIMVAGRRDIARIVPSNALLARSCVRTVSALAKLVLTACECVQERVPLFQMRVCTSR